MQNGKGSRARNNYSREFRENFARIKWTAEKVSSRVRPRSKVASASSRDSK